VKPDSSGRGDLWNNYLFALVNNMQKKDFMADTKGFQTYTPPTNGRGNDWILIIENAEMNFPLP
jgi:hypothetical protein